jgi:hypothetical protein
MASRPTRNSLRFRHVLSRVEASATHAGSRVFQASSARRTFSVAVAEVKGGKGGRLVGSRDAVPARGVARGVRIGAPF